MTIVLLVSPVASQLTVFTQTMVESASMISPDTSQLTVVAETVVSIMSLVGPSMSQLIASLVSPDLYSRNYGEQPTFCRPCIRDFEQLAVVNRNMRI